MANFYETITEAVAWFTDHGFTDTQELSIWLDRIRISAELSMIPEATMRAQLLESLRAIYTRMIDKGGILPQHPGVDRFTLEQVKPKLRIELDRRILASANLIKLNRAAAINKTLQRFSGWATSIPPGGSDNVERNPVKNEIRKSLTALPYEVRRVNIDQGHKFVSQLSNLVATDGGALAGRWVSHYRQIGYNFRPDHKARDDKIYTMRNNWAIQAGLMKVGKAGYMDSITQPGEEVYCRCYYVFLYSLRRLPPDMLTAKGRATLSGMQVAA